MLCEEQTEIIPLKVFKIRNMKIKNILTQDF